MKKLTFIFLIGFFALLGSAASAQTSSTIPNCVTGGGGEYNCTPVAATFPSGCSQGTTGYMRCLSIPAGYVDRGTLPPPPTVHVTVTPSSGEAGKINPTVSWSASTDTTYPTTCSGDGISSNNGPASGSVTLGIISSVGTKKYTVTCTNAIGSGTDSASVSVSAAAAAQPTTQQSAANPCTNAGGGKLGYCPLEPLPGLGNGGSIEFVPFLQTVFKLLIIAGALLAVATLVYAGISYILSEAFETKGEAKKRMVAAFYGLAILLGAWLMLYTINPTLLNFDLSSIGGGGGPSTGTTGTTQQTTPHAPTQQEKNACESAPGKTLHADTGNTWVCY